MAAYAALVSLMHIVEQIQNHRRPPISLDKIQVESLSKNVAFLQDFLERYPHDGSKEADDLESRIRDTAHAAEDVIESHIVDQIRGGTTSSGRKSSSIDFYQDLQCVIEEMSSIKQDVMDIKEKTMRIHDHLKKNSMPATSLRSPPTGQNTMVSFDGLLYEIMDKLTGGQLDRQVIPISGMGGIGKTTLARNIFKHETIVSYFDILAWVTISQEYSIKEILLETICQENERSRKDMTEKSEDELGETLHKKLIGRRYLIVMDDMWCIDVWDELKRFFPHDNNGSRILITTRDSQMASQLTQTHSFKMNLLDEDKGWDLLCKNVFGEEDCPLDLKEIGKKIAKNCKGLPLSIVVIGRVLARSRQTQEYWEGIAGNLSSIVNLEDNEHCLKLLRMSYRHLPVHLKPCFLYMGVFHEDHAIPTSMLIRLWVAEGFLKPISGKSLEIVAEEYLKDLIDWNLIFTHKRGSNGRIKSCVIHDLLRDLCLREAEREKFLCAARQYNLDIQKGISTQRRFTFHRRTSCQVLPYLSSPSLVRSLTYDFGGVLPYMPAIDFRLLRVLNASGENYLYPGKATFPRSLEGTFSQLINLRYLAINFVDSLIKGPQLFPSFHLLWNVQTLIVTHTVDFIAPSEIWKMSQLRHVKIHSLELPDPPSGCTDGCDDLVLDNLQTLMKIKNFKCGEEVVKRIPRVKKLKVTYNGAEGWSLSCFNNLDLLKLESLYCDFLSIDETSWTDLLRNITFPRSLKKLTLRGCTLHWDDINTKIGSLPLLEALELLGESTIGDKWETVEEGFHKLKYLKIGSSTHDLKWWTTDSTHFPVLEYLVLEKLGKLEEIPLELGNISTLWLIDLYGCSKSAVKSANKIAVEQEELGNVDLQVRAR